MKNIIESDDYLSMCDNSGISKDEWRHIIKQKKDIKKISRDRLKHSILRGIPEKYRGYIWCLLCNCDTEASDYDKKIYFKLVEMDNPKDEYNITKDIHRTLPELKMF